MQILESKGRLRLHGAWFDISTGELWVMDPATRRFFEAADGMRNRIAALLFCALSSAAPAAENAEAIVEKWYAALEAVDRAAFETLIADDGVITLNDLETDQSKREFIESLDEWQDAMRGAEIRHKTETATPDTASVLVCYTFPGNETLGRETFRVENSKVRESVQTVIGDSCAEY